MFVQFYPGPSNYPNDNITKRLDWLRNALSKLLDILDLDSLTFPPHLIKHENYLNVIDDFRKKYFLKYRSSLRIDDYHGNILPLDSDPHEVHYAEPLSISRIPETHDAVIDVSPVSTQTDH